MSRIKIKHFGSIKDGLSENEGWIEIKKVIVFIGEQGSGKSSVTKLISTFLWMEKVLFRGDFTESDFTTNNFKDVYCAYHGLKEYFKDDMTEIFYEGDIYHIYYTKEKGLSITKKSGEPYFLPQILYIPSERNILNLIDKPNLIKTLPSPLLSFLIEYDKAKNNIAEGLDLPINNTTLEYVKSNNILNIIGRDYKVNLMEASSGFQSLVPLYLVSWYLAKIVKEQSDSSNKMSSEQLKRFQEGVQAMWEDESLTDEQRRAGLSALSSKFNKTAFINIIEEPEQSLSPVSQDKVMADLLKFNNYGWENKLIFTTHSPYIINYLTLAVKASQLKNKATNEQKKELNKIFPIDSVVYSEELRIYEFDAKGSISILDNYKGLPSDENYLNEQIEEVNIIFSKLLNLEGMWK